MGSVGEIHAFEPVEENLEKLNSQFSNNGLKTLRSYRYAVAERDGFVEFGLSANSATGHIQAGAKADGNTCRVACVRLDREVGEIPFHFGKMDIEGAEILALRGAEGMLDAANPPVWLLELGGYSKRFGVRSHEVVQFLKERAYDCAVYDPLQERLVYSDTPWILGIENVIAVSRDRRDRVEARIAGNR